MMAREVGRENDAGVSPIAQGACASSQRLERLEGCGVEPSSTPSGSTATQGRGGENHVVSDARGFDMPLSDACHTNRIPSCSGCPERPLNPSILRVLFPRELHSSLLTYKFGSWGLGDENQGRSLAPTLPTSFRSFFLLFCMQDYCNSTPQILRHRGSRPRHSFFPGAFALSLVWLQSTTDVVRVCPPDFPPQTSKTRSLTRASKPEEFARHQSPPIPRRGEVRNSILP